MIERKKSELGNEYTYYENFWTGKKELKVNDIPLTKIGKKNFQNGTKNYELKGNFLTGVNVVTDDESVAIIRKLEVYEYILVFLPLYIIGFGILGGAIGGGIAGALGAICAISIAVLIRKINNAFLKVLLSLGFCAAAFIVFWIIMIFVGIAFLA